MNKTYIYKWYKNTGEYVGTLSNVVSEFGYSQSINTEGVEIDIELGLSLNSVDLNRDVTLLIDENGDHVIDENGGRIITESNYYSDTLPWVNDRIEVWEYSDTDTDGTKMFNGFVSRWNGSYSSGTMTLTLLSFGFQLDNFLIQVLPEEVLTANDPANINDEEILYPTWKTPQNRTTGVGQTFQLPGASEVNKIRITLGNSGTQAAPARVSIVQGTPTSPGTVLATTTKQIPTQSNILTEFQFSESVTLAGSTTYHFVVFNDYFSPGATQILTIGSDTVGNYPSGAMYIFNDSSGWSSTTDDLSFEIISSTGSVGNQFINKDVSQIVRTAIDNFNNLGGLVTYDSSSIDETYTIIPEYTFKVATHKEVVDKALELAPSDWYWYANPRDDLVYFKGKSNTIDHYLYKGINVEDINITYTLEQITNKVYFSGGDTGGGINLALSQNNDNSVTRYGHWLKKLSDNRVTDPATAQILVNSALSENSVPRFQVEVQVASDDYETNAFMIGQNVAFRDFNNLIDSLILQIVTLDYTPNITTLTLGLLPPTLSRRIEDLKRDLEKQETENDPSDI